MKIYTWNLFIAFIILIIATSCVETQQTYYINPDGSGRVHVEADMMLNPGVGTKSSLDSLEHKTQTIIRERIYEILHEAEGTEAWQDVSYSITPQKRLYFSGTAYFPDIEKFNLPDIPAARAELFNRQGLKWAMTKQQTKYLVQATDTLTRSQADSIANKISEDYQGSRGVLVALLNMFKLEATYHFPYKLKEVRGAEQIDAYTADIAIEGEQVLKGLDVLMENQRALRRLVEEKGVRSFDFNDPRLLKAAYPDGAIWSVQFRDNWFSGAKTYFNYKATVGRINPKIPAIQDIKGILNPQEK